MQEWDDILEKEKEISQLESEIAVLRKIICDKLHPYKVGDIITVMGYSHNGKKMKVTGVWFSNDVAGARMGVSGVVLLKDGRGSKNRTGWNHWGDPILEHAISGLVKNADQRTEPRTERGNEAAQ